MNTTTTTTSMCIICWMAEVCLYNVSYVFVCTVWVECYFFFRRMFRWNRRGFNIITNVVLNELHKVSMSRWEIEKKESIIYEVYSMKMDRKTIYYAQSHIQSNGRFLIFDVGVEWLWESFFSAKYGARQKATSEIKIKNFCLKEFKGIFQSICIPYEINESILWLLLHYWLQENYENLFVVLNVIILCIFFCVGIVVANKSDIAHHIVAYSWKQRKKFHFNAISPVLKV